MSNRAEIAKKLRAIPKRLDDECFYVGGSWYNIEPELFEMIFEIVCGSLDGEYNDIFIKLADLIDPKAVTNNE